MQDSRDFKSTDEVKIKVNGHYRNSSKSSSYSTYSLDNSGSNKHNPNDSLQAEIYMNPL